MLNLNYAAIEDYAEIICIFLSFTQIPFNLEEEDEKSDDSLLLDF
jgi:hypothetical protein